MKYSVSKNERNKTHPYYVVDQDGVDVAHCIDLETAKQIAKVLEGYEIEKQRDNLSPALSRAGSQIAIRAIVTEER